MRFAVGPSGWPIGATCIEAKTIVDTTDMEPGMAALLEGPLGVPPPDCQALDQDTYDRMVAAYGYHKVGYGPGIIPKTSNV